jgi:transcriptional regulator with XRE-family HTH domain
MQGANAKCKLAALNLEKSLKFSRAVVSAIQTARKSQGLSQQRLAEMAGISRSAVTMIESGARNPTLFVCHALAESLDLDLSELIREAHQSLQSKRPSSK